MKEAYFPALVGACVIALAVIFFSQAYNTRNAMRVSGAYELTARFNNIDGIKIGSDVLMTGVSVGKVSSVNFDSRSYQAILTLRLQPDIALPRDTVAMILSEGMLGNKFLKIEPGGALETLRPGDEFNFVQDSVIFEELLHKVILAAELKRAIKSKAN